jgi:hypothetical protein
MFIIGFITIHLFLFSSAYTGSWVIDPIKAGQFGDFIGGYVGTIFLLLSIVLLYSNLRLQRKTLAEMETQRIAMYKPELSLMDIHLYAFFEFNESHLDLYFTNEAFHEKGNTERGANVNLYNIGYGLAKSISYKWEYDIFEFAKLINNKDAYVVTTASHFLEVKNEKFNFVKNCNYNLEERRINFLLPFSNSKETYKIQIPDAYLVLMIIHFNQQSNANANFDITQLFLSKLSLILNYKNSEGKEISDKIVLSIDYSHVIPENQFFKYKEAGYPITSTFLISANNVT